MEGGHVRGFDTNMTHGKDIINFRFGSQKAVIDICEEEKYWKHCVASKDFEELKDEFWFRPVCSSSLFKMACLSIE